MAALDELKPIRHGHVTQCPRPELQIKVFIQDELSEMWRHLTHPNRMTLEPCLII